MPIPNPVRLFHITAIANLPNVFANGELLSKNSGAENGITYTNIAHHGAQSSRATRSAPNPPGGNIHDYVPFYFAPRSPMLRTIEGGNVLGCDLRQSDIVHIETTVDLALGHGEPFVIYDRNATKPYSTPYTTLEGLNSVAWDLITEAPQLDGYCKYWHDIPSNDRYVDRMEKRMAEFMVKGKVPITAIRRIGVINNAKMVEVTGIVATYNLNIPVVVMPSWYF